MSGKVHLLWTNGGRLEVRLCGDNEICVGRVHAEIILEPGESREAADWRAFTRPCARPGCGHPPVRHTPYQESGTDTVEYGRCRDCACFSFITAALPVADESVRVRARLAELEAKVDSHAQWHGSHDAEVERRLPKLEAPASGCGWNGVCHCPLEHKPGCHLTGSAKAFERMDPPLGMEPPRHVAESPAQRERAWRYASTARRTWENVTKIVMSHVVFSPGPEADKSWALPGITVAELRPGDKIVQGHGRVRLGRSSGDTRWTFCPSGAICSHAEHGDWYPEPPERKEEGK